MPTNEESRLHARRLLEMACEKYENEYLLPPGTLTRNWEEDDEDNSAPGALKLKEEINRQCNNRDILFEQVKDLQQQNAQFAARQSWMTEAVREIACDCVNGIKGGAITTLKMCQRCAILDSISSRGPSPSTRKLNECAQAILRQGVPPKERIFTPWLKPTPGK